MSGTTAVRNETSTVQETTTTTTTTNQSQNQIYEYFQYAVIIVGAVGFLINGIILLAMALSPHLKTHMMNLLILNQIAIDFYSCCVLFVTYAIKVRNLVYATVLDEWLCKLVTSEMLIWVGLDASPINLSLSW